MRRLATVILACLPLQLSAAPAEDWSDVCTGADTAELCRPDIVIAGTVRVGDRLSGWGTVTLTEGDILRRGRSCSVTLWTEIHNLGLVNSPPTKIRVTRAIPSAHVFDSLGPRERIELRSEVRLSGLRTTVRVDASPIGDAATSAGLSDTRWLVLVAPRSCASSAP